MTYDAFLSGSLSAGLGSVLLYVLPAVCIGLVVTWFIRLALR